MGPYGPTWAHMGPHGPIYGPIRAHMGPYMGPYGPQPGQGPNPDRAPTRTGPQPGPGHYSSIQGCSQHVENPSANNMNIDSIVLRSSKTHDIQLIDCQMKTDHLMRMGAHEISRKEFLNQLDRLVPNTLMNKSHQS